MIHQQLYILALVRVAFVTLLKEVAIIHFNFNIVQLLSTGQLTVH